MIAALGAALGLLLAGASVAAAASEFHVETLDVALRVAPDGTMIVSETLDAEFVGHTWGLTRTVPLDQPGGPVALDLVLFNDTLDRPQAGRAARVGRTAEMKVHASMPLGLKDIPWTFHIHYRVRGAITADGDGTALRWIVTDGRWNVAVPRIHLRVVVPSPIPGHAIEGYADVVRPDGRGVRHDAVVTPHGVSVPSLERVRGDETLTLMLRWPAGYVTPSRVVAPTPARALAPTVASRLAWLVPLGVLGLCLLLRAQSRETASERAVMPQYEPPDGLRAAELGVLVDESVEPRDVVAAVVELAVRGYLRIERVANSADGDDYLISLKRPWLGDPEISPFETIVLAQIYRTPQIQARYLSELRKAGGQTVGPIRDQIYRDLVARGYFRTSPRHARQAWRVAGIGVACVWAQLALLAGASWSTLAAGVVAGAVVFFAGIGMSRLTPAGAAARDRARGFREFLQRAERDRIERLAPDTLHRLLPHAIALGITEAWISRFERLPVPPPGWYTDERPFSVPGYEREISALGRSLGAAWRARAA
jgi:hypothetical protein